MAGPLHERIAADLRHRITSGALAVGDPLPSEAQLSATWHGSRGPVRQALASLRAEGLIGGGPGKPPVVRRESAPQPFDTFLSFSRWAEQLGRRPGQRTAEVARRPASAELAAALEIAPGDPVVQVVRLRTLDDEPTMLERSTFSGELGQSLFHHDLDSGSIYAYLTTQGLRVGRGRHVIDAVAADATDVELLGVDPGVPLLRERRSAWTADGVPFEYSDDRYRPDLVSFTIENAPEATASPARSWSPADATPPGVARPHERRTP